MIARRLTFPIAAFFTFTLTACVSAPRATAQQPLQPERMDVPAAEAANVVVDPRLFADMDYRSVGPSRGGRVTTVTGHPSHPGTFYMGSTGGGVWKTDDYGLSWRNVSDGYFATASMGAIRVAPSDPDIVYAGTGSDGIRSNVILGRGIYRSDDAGETWRFLGLRETGQIGAVEVHPTNPDLVWIAALGSPFGPSEDRGVYRSSDGGRTWEQVLFVADSIGAVDLELHPTNPQVIYASLWRAERKPWTIISGGMQTGGIYRSTDGGTTWEKQTTGLPAGLIGKSDLAVSPADPDRVYAVVEAPDPEEGLYRSDDAGVTWRLVSNRDGLMNRPFYYTNVDADPTNADIVYVNNEGFYKSTDAGETWERIRTPHGDNHDMWINPDDPDIWIQSNDGGANVTVDGGETWSTQLNQPTAELYQVDVDDRFPYWLFAGQQDNSTIGVPSLPPTSWRPDHNAGNWMHAGGCETGPAVPAWGTPYIYANCKGRFGQYDRRTTQEKQYYVGANYMYGHATRDLTYRFQRVSPIEVSPHDSGVIYHGSQYVHRTTDGGMTWETISEDLTATPPGTQGVSGEPITRDITGEEIYSTLYAIEVSPLDENVIWVGSNDGLFHMTRDGGASWQDITPPDLPSGGRVSNIDPSPHDAGTAYYAYYRWLVADDYEPYIYRTTDYGRTWSRLTDGTNGIPVDYAVRVVREDPEREGLLYAGTEFGMFVSFDDGAHWQSFQLDLPVTPVTDLKVHEGDLVLSTMGRGFWILDDVTLLRQLPASGRVSLASAVGSPGLELLAPPPAYRMRVGFGYGFGSNPAAPDYGEGGAALDYWVGEAPAGELTLEIVDAVGNVVRGLSSHEGGWEYRFTQGMREPVAERIGGPRLATSPGHHRVHWDLEQTGPWSPSDRSRGQRGPMAVPGAYTVRLAVDGEVVDEAPLTVHPDPRVIETGTSIEDMQAQLELNLRIRDLLSRAARTAWRIDQAQEELAGVSGSEAAQARNELQELEARLVTDPLDEVSSYPQPMLQAQIGYLYNMTTSADQRPGRDAYTRYEQLAEQLEAIVVGVDAILGGM